MKLHNSVGKKTNCANCFLPQNLSSNAGGMPSVAVLPLVIWYISDRCPARQHDHHWSWRQQQPDWRWGNLVGGACLGSCASGWIRAEIWGASLEVMGNLWPDLIGGLVAEPWTFSGFIGFWALAEAHDFDSVLEHGKGHSFVGRSFFQTFKSNNLLSYVWGELWTFE